MAKKKTKTEETETVGVQLEMLDVKPKNSKEITKAARLYKKYQADRQTALSREVEQKQKILELVKAEHLQPLESGKTTFKVDGMIISVTPRDELVTVKDATEPED